MKKALLALLLLALCAGSVWFFLRPPTFSGPYAGLKEALWRYGRETDPSKRYVLAAKIQLSPISVKLAALMASLEKNLEHLEGAVAGMKGERQEKLAGPDAQAEPAEPDLTDAEKATAKDALAHYEETNRRFAELDASLTPEDVAYVTAENPSSLYRRLGTFAPRQACGAAEVESLRKEMDAKTLEERAPHVMLLAVSYEGRFQDSYRRRKAELLGKEERLAGYRDLEPLLSDEVADGLKGSFATLMGSANPEQRIRSAELELAKTGVEASKAPAYVAELAAKYPGCLGRLNIDLVRQLRGDKH